MAMSETHVISALRAKRAEVSGSIHDLEKKVKRMRANLAHIDATIRVFAPDLNPDSIPPKRRYRRTRYFAHAELSRRCLDALRAANGTPITAPEIAKAAMTDKGMSVDDDALLGAVTEMVLLSLGRLRRRDAVSKTGTSRDAKWALSSPI
jgi:hypothetical protein